MNSARSRGFTLIELLTVIAIIAILAAMTATTLPRVLEKAKVTSAESDLKAIEKALAVFASNHGTYPPGLGFRILGPDDADPTVGHVNTEDYMTQLDLKNAKEIYDRFADGKVPYIYIPVNMGQFNQFKAMIAKIAATAPTAASPAAIDAAKGADASLNNTTSPLVLTPPSNYDAYVLLSVGPNGKPLTATPLVYDYSGICYTDALGNLQPETVAQGADAGETVEVSALRAFYRATRDLNNNQALDFDWRARTRQGEGKAGNFVSPPILTVPAAAVAFHLPSELDNNGASTSGTASGAGPIIFVSAK
jgi:prepilin-type N-terminal cleavage/methylation domain-containing protein